MYPVTIQYHQIGGLYFEDYCPNTQTYCHTGPVALPEQIDHYNWLVKQYSYIVHVKYVEQYAL